MARMKLISGLRKAFYLAGILGLLIFTMAQRTGQVQVDYVDYFENTNHPEVAYWFFTSGMMAEDTFKSRIDNFAANSKYTLIYLTARQGSDFYDVATMHPVFEKLVKYAHGKGLQIGLQIWKNDEDVPLENCDCLMQENEVTLDGNGKGHEVVVAKNARNMKNLLKSELFRVYAFKKAGDGFYEPGTVKEITSHSQSGSGPAQIEISLDAGPSFSGYTAYILTRHYYRSCSNYTTQAVDKITGIFKAYSDIPFDAIGLDEYKNLTIPRATTLKLAHNVFRERLYSTAMAARMKKTTGDDLGRVLFDMRYAPKGNPVPRIRAINTYMDLLRTATLDVEKAMFETGKKAYGPETFIGLHNTFHNNLNEDEVWQTGVSWWNIRRDYGQTDEETPIPIQLGIGMCNSENAMYNMYYSPSLERIWTKALYDLRYGVRTHYHAANDVQGWGVSIDSPEALARINRVENCARLMNRFNPPFPDIRLLVVYGMEAIFDWYPDESQRGLYDTNDKLAMAEKSMELWNHGYLNVGVPSDVIEDGRLTLNADGKPSLKGHVFDAVIFLNPMYAKKKTFLFLQDYAARDGKLLVEGRATRDFEGNDITPLWDELSARLTATSFTPENVRKLGIQPNTLTDGVANGNGTFTFTSIESLETDKPATFSFASGGHTFRGIYKGLAVVRVDEQGNLVKLAATAFGSLDRDGREICHTSPSPADVFITAGKGEWKAVIADKNHSIKLLREE